MSEDFFFSRCKVSIVFIRENESSAAEPSETINNSLGKSELEMNDRPSVKQHLQMGQSRLQIARTESTRMLKRDET